MKKRTKERTTAKLRPKRALSQNFLIDRAVAGRIADALDIAEGDIVFEVGAGKGFLTEFLLERGARVTAVDKDSRMIGLLKKKFPAGSGVDVIFADVLNMPESFFPRTKCILAGNLPYGISHPLIFWILENKPRWKWAVVMLQREVAQRICAGPGEKGRSAVSIQIQLEARPTYLFDVGPAAFYPRPKVTSAVVRLDFPQATGGIEINDAFRYIVQVAFGQKRKNLANNLRAIPGVTPQEVDAVLQEAGVDRSRRAEQLTMEEFAALARAVRAVWGGRLAGGDVHSASSRRRSDS